MPLYGGVKAVAGMLLGTGYTGKVKGRPALGGGNTPTQTKGS